MAIAVKIINYSSPEYHRSVEVRYKILREPLCLVFTKEQLAAEHDQIHFAAFDNDQLIGTLILKDAGNGEMQMRQVSVLPEYQGSGVGKQLVVASEEYAKVGGYKRMVLHSRDVAVSFYERLGYTVEGEGFVEVTIPHHLMVKHLV